MHAPAPKETDLVASPPEISLLRAAWRRILLVVLFAAAGLGGGMMWASRSTDLFQAQAEILVRYAYEYTPLSVESGTDSMQLRVDPDLALNSEVQMLTSPPVIAAALQAAPRLAQGNRDPSQREIEEVARLVAVSRIEGTSIIHVEVRAPDGDWALRFTTALLDAYRTRRAELFSAREEMTALQQTREELAKELQDLDTRSAEVSGALRAAAAEAGSSQNLVLWATAGLNLIQGIGGAESAASSLNENASPSGAATPQLSLIGRLLEEFLASRTPLPAQPGAQEDGVDAAAKEAEQLQAIMEEATALQRRREGARAALATTEELIQRIEFRRDVGQRVDVFSPPHTLSSPVGISPFLKIVLSAVLGLMIGLFLAVLLEGGRRGSRAMA